MRRALRLSALGFGLLMGLVLSIGARVRPPHSMAETHDAAVLTAAGQQAPPQVGVPVTSTSEHATTRNRTEQYTLSEERYHKAVEFSRAEYELYFVSYALSILVLVLLLRFGIAAKLRDFAENFSGNRFAQGLLFIPALLIILDLLELPVRMYWHSLSLHYQQSVQRWGSWLLDWSKEELLGIGFGIVLVLILFIMMRWSPRRWWFYFWLATLPILLFVLFISPWFIDPLFNKFEPLNNTHPELVSSIEKLTERAGVPIPSDRMFLMRASNKTNELNAYVTGVGASKRVVIWDTLIQKTSKDETLFITGHELGHYVLGHVWKGFLAGALGLLAALYLIFRGLHWMLDRWGHEWKLYGPEDWASLAVFLLLFQVLTFLASPVINGFSRMQEHAADVYGLEVIHGVVPDAQEVAAHAFQILGEVDLADPNPPAIITFWLYSHPPLAERLVFAHSYDPWAKGESPKYVKSAMK
jgi:STE24 endopeptidase